MKKYLAMAIVLSFIVLMLLFPGEIYDRFLWKYFVGPVIADALGHPVTYHGITAREGYSIVSEIVYGSLLIASIFLLYLIFERFKIRADKNFFLSTLPFILLGSVGRVLEDSNILSPPFSYFFISPLIYIQIGIYFSIALVFGLILKKEKYFAIIAFLITFLYSIFYSFFGNYFHHAIHPIIFLLIALISIYIYVLFPIKDYNAAIFSFGILFFTPSFLVFLSLPFKITINYHPYVIISLILSLALTIFIYILSKKSAKMFHEFTSISTIFSHGLDSFTTWLAVSGLLGKGIYYGEKHPLPAFLLKKFYGLPYPLLKILVIMLIIYSIDDLKENLKNTIKWLMLFIGLAPGLRDFLRILIGV